MKKTSLIFVLVIALLFAFAGCTAADTGTDEESAEQTVISEETDETTVDEEVTDEDTTEEETEDTVIDVVGSAMVSPLIEGLAEMFMEANSGVTVEVSTLTSDDGLSYCAYDLADIGLLSRDLTEDEQVTYSEVDSTVLCAGGIAVIVGADSGVTDLTAEDIAAIFTGEITDWSDAGGEEGTITPYIMNSGDLRDAFEALFLGTDDDGNAVISDEDICTAVETAEDMAAAIADDSLGIGFIPLADASDYDVTVADIDGVEATPDNITSGDYVYYRNFYLLTPIDVSDAAAAFIEYCTSDEDAIAYIEEAGYVIQ